MPKNNKTLKRYKNQHKTRRRNINKSRRRKMSNISKSTLNPAAKSFAPMKFGSTYVHHQIPPQQHTSTIIYTVGKKDINNDEMTRELFEELNKTTMSSKHFDYLD